MGTAISTAAHGVGAVLGSAFAAPFKIVFGGSCEGICSGTWDVTCFIEHLCISDLVKLLMVFGLCYITIMFLYLLLKVGIIQCIGKSLCKMCWAACETYWFILEDITCFLWHKLTNVKRVNRRRRRRFQDIELGSSSSGESESLDNFYSWSADRKQKPVRRKNQLQNSLHFARQHPKCRSGSHHHHHHHHHHHERLKTGASLSVRVKGSSQRVRSLKKLQIRRVHNPRRKRVTFKRRLR